MKELAAALSAAQAEFPPIAKSKTVKVQTTKGAYSFNYAPLDAILDAVRPPLSKHGLSVSQTLTHIDGKAALRTMLLHSSGDVLEDVFPLPIAPLVAAQELGAILTYCRRYAAVAILGIATEEADEQATRARRPKPSGESTGDSATSATAGQAADAKPAGSAAASPGGQGSAFRAPTGPRGGQSAQLEADEIASELRHLVEELGATDSLPKIEEKRAAADITWLKRQRTTAQNSLARRAAEAN